MTTAQGAIRVVVAAMARAFRVIPVRREHDHENSHWSPLEERDHGNSHNLTQSRSSRPALADTVPRLDAIEILSELTSGKSESPPQLLVTYTNRTEVGRRTWILELCWYSPVLDRESDNVVYRCPTVNSESRTFATVQP